MAVHKYIQTNFEIPNDTGRIVNGYKTIAGNEVDDDREAKFAAFELGIKDARTDAEKKFVESLNKTTTNVPRETVPPPSTTKKQKTATKKDKKETPTPQKESKSGTKPAATEAPVAPTPEAPKTTPVAPTTAPVVAGTTPTATSGIPLVVPAASVQFDNMKAALASTSLPANALDLAMQNSFYELEVTTDNATGNKTFTPKDSNKLNFAVFEIFLKDKFNIDKMGALTLYNTAVVAANPGLPAGATVPKDLAISKEGLGAAIAAVRAKLYGPQQGGPQQAGANGMPPGVDLNSEEARKFPYLYAYNHGLDYDPSYGFRPKNAPQMGGNMMGGNMGMGNAWPNYGNQSQMGNAWPNYGNQSQMGNNWPNYGNQSQMGNSPNMDMQNNRQYTGWNFLSDVISGMWRGNQQNTGFNYWNQPNYQNLPRWMRGWNS